MQIGQFAAAKDYSRVEDDIYEATISACSVVMDPAKPAIALEDKYGKKRLLIVVHLDHKVGNDGGPIELRRQLPISYGKNNSTGTHSALAVLIQAAVGIPAGDASQRHVTTEELVGKKLRVQTRNVTKDDKTYTNLVDFLAPRKAEPIPAQFVHIPKDEPEFEDPIEDDQIPFPDEP